MIPIHIRPFEESDFDEVVALWHHTNIVSYPYVEEHQRHTLYDAREYFRDHVLADCSVVVAVADEGPVGLIAIDGALVAQLCVAPHLQRMGIGTLLLDHAKQCSPEGLFLYTFQRNAPARSFYERHGFIVAAFGTSPSPENEPDVEYRWRPNPAP